jgi:hypothetical protein
MKPSTLNFPVSYTKKENAYVVAAMGSQPSMPITPLLLNVVCVKLWFHMTNASPTTENVLQTGSYSKTTSLQYTALNSNAMAVTMALILTLMMNWNSGCSVQLLHPRHAIQPLGSPSPSPHPCPLSLSHPLY